MSEKFAPASTQAPTRLGAPYFAGEMPGFFPAVGDLLAVRSKSDPSVEFDLRLSADRSDGEWAAVVVGIGRGMEPLASFDGIRLRDEVRVARGQIASLTKCTRLSRV